MLELWGIQNTPSLPSLPGPLWPRVVAPDGSSRTKLCIHAKLNCLKEKCFLTQKLYNFKLNCSNRTVLPFNCV